MADRPPSDHVAAWRALLVIPIRWYDALFSMYEAPNRRLRLAEMAKATLLNRSGLTRLVHRLGQVGLLTREPCADDARGAFAVLTPDGPQALRRCWRIYGAEIEARLGRRLTVSEARMLRALLARFVEAA